MSITELVEKQPVGTHMVSSFGTIWYKVGPSTWRLLTSEFRREGSNRSVLIEIGYCQAVDASWSFS